MSDEPTIGALVELRSVGEIYESRVILAIGDLPPPVVVAYAIEPLAIDLKSMIETSGCQCRRCVSFLRISNAVLAVFEEERKFAAMIESTSVVHH